jgi:hypothetical protein
MSPLGTQPGKGSKIEQAKKMVGRLTKNPYVNNPGKKKEGDEKYIVKTKGNTAYFPGAKHTDTDTEKKSTDLSYNKEEIVPVPVSGETYKQKVSNLAQESMEKLNKRRQENQDIEDLNQKIIDERNLKTENDVQKVSPKTRKEKPVSEARKKMQELDEQGIDFSKDFKDTSFKNRRAGVELLKDEINTNKKSQKTKKEKVPTKPLSESVKDLQNKNIADLLGKNMQMMQDLPLQPSKIADKFKTMDAELIGKMNKGEDISKDLNNLNALGNIINKAQDPKEKESLLKQYNQLQKEVKNYTEAVKFKKEENKEKKVEPVSADSTTTSVEAKPKLSENISVNEEGLQDKTEENKNEIKPKTTVAELVVEPTIAEAETLKDFTQSVSNTTSAPTSQPKPVVEKKVVSSVAAATQENVVAQQEVKTEKEEVKEVLSNIDEVIKKRAEEILASHGIKEKKPENVEGSKEKKKGFWWRLWNGTREGLKKRDDRLNSPELKKKYEELNTSLEKDIGKVGNKSLTVIGDALFGNFLKGIKDGIISNKNWSGAIGEAVGSIVTRYLNTSWNIIEVVGGLFKALGKKAWVSARSLVAK